MDKPFGSGPAEVIRIGKFAYLDVVVAHQTESGQHVPVPAFNRRLIKVIAFSVDLRKQIYFALRQLSFLTHLYLLFLLFGRPVQKTPSTA